MLATLVRSYSQPYLPHTAAVSAFQPAFTTGGTGASLEDAAGTTAVRS